MRSNTDKETLGKTKKLINYFNFISSGNDVFSAQVVGIMNKIMLELRNDIFLLYKRRFPSIKFRPSTFKYDEGDKALIRK